MVKTVTDVKAGSGDTSSLAAAVIAKATAPSTATKAGKVGKDGLLDPAEAETLALSAEELLDQCKCPISLELMRRPVLPSSGQAFDEVNLLRWSESGNTKCPVSGQELIMRKDKLQYTKHHLLRNIIRQQAAKAGVYLPPVEKEQLLADVHKPAYFAKALQALFEDRCLGYIEKHVMMRTLKDLVKRKSLNKLSPEVDGKPSTLLLMVIRYCLAARKADLVKYGRKLLKDDVSFWRDAEVISEVLGLAEDTEHRGDILLDIEEKFSDTQVGPREFVKAVLQHRSEKNPVQRTLEKVASEVLSFKAAAYEAGDWTAEDQGELLNMALALLHSQCVDAGVCCTQIGLGFSKWSKALHDLQSLGCSLSTDNLKILFGSPIHAQVLQQITAGGHRTTLEWHLDEHNSGFVRMLCLDRIALPTQPRSHLLGSHLDHHQEETSTDEEEEDEEIDIDEMALQLDDNGNYTEEQLMMFDDATREALQDSEPEEEDNAQDNSSGPQAAERNMSQLEADLRDRYFSQETARAAQRRRIR